MRHYAAKSGRTSAVKWLLGRGADAYIRDGNGLRIIGTGGRWLVGFGLSFSLLLPGCGWELLFAGVAMRLFLLGMIRRSNLPSYSLPG